MKPNFRHRCFAVCVLACCAFLPGCQTASNASANAAIKAAIPSSMTVRFVDKGNPAAVIIGVQAAIHPASGPASFAGSSNDKGEITLPVVQSAVYIFSLNGRTLLGQTAENLFNLVPSGATYYTRGADGVVVVPLDFTPTNSPLVSPINKPNFSPSNNPADAPQVIKVGK